MLEVKILGISGTPRKNGNTTKLVEKALEGAMSVPGIKTGLYEMAGKKIHHCIACYKCYRTGECALKDDFQNFARKYVEADGILMGAPVYHMSIPASMKAALDRLGHSIFTTSVAQSKPMPMFNKVCGALTVGASRYGGQELVLNFMLHSFLLMNSVPVAGNTTAGDYIGAPANLRVSGLENLSSEERWKKKDIVLKDGEGVTSAMELGKRVAIMARVVKAGLSVLKRELPSEYFYTLDELPCR